MFVLFFCSSSSTSAEDNTAWINIVCHKVVIRAASSFFDRLFSQNFTEECIVVEEGIEASVVANNSEKQQVLQLTFHKISSHSIQTLVEFAYTGSVKLDSSVLQKVVEDLQFMKMQSMLDKLGYRLEEELSYSNCIPNLIVSYMLGKEEAYREALFFVIDEFSRGIKRGERFEASWRKVNKSETPAKEMSVEILLELKKEVEETEKLGLAEDSYLIKLLVNLIEMNSISKDDEVKLLNFLITKRREKCSAHLQNIVLYCYTDNEQLCLECLVDSHAQHHIEHISRAVCKKMAPQWERVEMELECIKQSSKDRISEWDQLSNLFRAEKSRDLEILGACAEIKTKMDKLSTIFKSGKVGPGDVDVLALKIFATALREDSEQLKVSYEKAKRVSDELLSLLYKRSVSCASIVDTDNTYELELLEVRPLKINIHQPLTITNCISILKAAKRIEKQEIYNDAFHFLCVNFLDVGEKSGQSFNRRINLFVLEELLIWDNLKVDSEDDVVLVVKEWLHFDIRHRKKFAEQLLRQVRFNHVSKEVLEKFENDPTYLLMLNDESKNMIIDACVGDNRGRRNSMITRLIVFGNNGVNASYDSRKDSWDEWKGDHHGYDFGVVMIGENVYIIGGQNADSQEYPLSKVSVYNVRTKTLKRGPSMTEERCSFGACVSSENTIYVIGGYDSVNYLSSVEMLKCNEIGEPIGSWTMLPPLNTAQLVCGASIIDDKIYAVGGSGGWLMEVFDLNIKAWVNCRAMSRVTNDCCVFTFDGEIYVIGQNGESEKYNPVTHTWTITAATTLEGSSRRGTAVLDDKIYFGGGMFCLETDIFEPKTGTWSKGPQLPTTMKNILSARCVAWKETVQGTVLS